MLTWFEWTTNPALEWMPFLVRLLILLSVAAGVLGGVLTLVAAAHAIHEGRVRRA